MQKCSICEKPLYGHPTAASKSRRVNGETVDAPGPVVCGSCPLNKAQGGPTGKSFFEVRIGMAKMVTKPVPAAQEGNMSDLKVKSNVRNLTILLDGRFPVVFDADGLAKIPAHQRPLMEREMIMRPGRFSYVVEEAPVSVEPALEAEVEVPVEVPPVEKVEEVVEEVAVPPGLDQSFLVEEEPVKPTKASKKKK